MAIDAAPETAKRLINGAKREVVTRAETEEQKELAQLLFELEDENFVGLIRWLYEKQPQERTRVLMQLSRLSSEQIARLTKLSEEDREKFIAVFGEEQREEGVAQESILSDEVRGEIRKATERVRSWRNKIRERRP